MKTNFFFTLFIFILFVVFSQSIRVYAADDISPTITPPLSPIITMENKEIQYDLPYPGLLPDNPLYFLKVLRDKITEFFISDPGKKADFALLQADKRMNTSIYLSHEKPVNDTLVSSTVSKALNYFEQTVTDIQQAKRQGEDINSFIHHMDTASQKYRQVILQLKTSASEQLKTDLTGDQVRLDKIRSTVVGMEKK